MLCSCRHVRPLPGAQAPARRGVTLTFGQAALDVLKEPVKDASSVADRHNPAHVLCKQVGVKSAVALA